VPIERSVKARRLSYQSHKEAEMAFSTTPYTTLADVKNAIRGLSSNEDDGFINLMIQRAQAVIDNYVGYPFQYDGTTGSPATRNFNGLGGLVLPIETFQSITQVQEVNQSVAIGYDGSVVFTSTPSDITADCVGLPLNQSPQYMLQRISGLYFEEGLQNYTVKGVFGYASVPLDVTLAATLLVAHYYGLRDTYYGNVLVQGNQTIKYTQPIPAHVRELLDRYRMNYFTAMNTTGAGPGNLSGWSI
jgi:hypothetical protein